MSQLTIQKEHLQREEWEYQVTAWWLLYHKHFCVTIIPLVVRSKGLSATRINYTTRAPTLIDRITKKNPKVSQWSTVAHVSSDMFYSVVANLRRRKINKI